MRKGKAPSGSGLVAAGWLAPGGATRCSSSSLAARTIRSPSRPSGSPHPRCRARRGPDRSPRGRLRGPRRRPRGRPAGAREGQPRAPGRADRAPVSGRCPARAVLRHESLSGEPVGAGPVEPGRWRRSDRDHQRLRQAPRRATRYDARPTAPAWSPGESSLQHLGPLLVLASLPVALGMSQPGRLGGRRSRPTRVPSTRLAGLRALLADELGARAGCRRRGYLQRDLTHAAL